MSLINDALRRASQTERDRPRPAPTGFAMEPVPRQRGSNLSVVLIVLMALALLLGGWFFWQWWMARNGVHPARLVNNPVPLTRPVVAAPPVVSPAPKPMAAVVAVKPVAPPVTAPAPAPVAIAPALAVPPAQSLPVTPTPAVPPPLVVDDSKTPWPIELKLTAIFFSLNHPRVILNGNIYGLGDEFQGITIKKVEKNKVILQWNHHTRELMMDGQ